MAVTVTRTPKVSKTGREVEKISVAWTCDASGNATGTIENMYGFIIKAVTDPTDGPTDNYDITLIDENGMDALGDALLNRDTTTTEQAYPGVTNASVPVFVCGDHTFTVANAGVSKSGSCVFYMLESL